jgi:Cu/Ag efflux protein CusF
MRHIFLLVCLVIAATNTGCRAALGERCAVQAEVISVDARKELIVLKHGEIPGLKPAMTMQYALTDPREIDKLPSGDKITADLVVRENQGRLQKISLANHGDGQPSSNPR